MYLTICCTFTATASILCGRIRHHAVQCAGQQTPWDKQAPSSEDIDMQTGCEETSSENMYLSPSAVLLPPLLLPSSSTAERYVITQCSVHVSKRPGLSSEVMQTGGGRACHCSRLNVSHHLLHHYCRRHRRCLHCHRRQMQRNPVLQGPLHPPPVRSAAQKQGHYYLLLVLWLLPGCRCLLPFPPMAHSRTGPRVLRTPPVTR